MIFVAYGGSGSSYLNRNLRALGKCHPRPDGFFKPMFYPTTGGQKLDARGYDNYPSRSSVPYFRERTSFRLDRKKTINDNMLEYVAGANKPGTSVVLTLASYYKFFSTNRIPDVTFLVRHPLHQYGSWFKPHRHGSHLGKFGGKDSEASLDFFSTLWAANVEEYLALKDMDLNPRLIRFEFVPQDVESAGCEALNKCFQGWDTSRRNPSFISSALAGYLRRRVAHVFGRIYPQWET